jgi:predicted RNA-binding Zn-ribbon protein involved in translation (DUF1610 family)
MNNTTFLALVQTVIAKHGKNIFATPRKFRSLVADYAEGEYREERRAINAALDTGCLADITNAKDLQSIKTQLVKRVTQEMINEKSANEALETLVFVIRGETLTPKEPPKPAPSVVAPPAAPHVVAQNNNSNENNYDTNNTNVDVRNSHQQQSNEEAYTVKCPHCGATKKITDRRELMGRSVGYRCDACGDNYKIEFFGTCKNCKDDVGFNACNIAAYLTVGLGNVVLDILNTKSGLTTALRAINEAVTPQANNVGECTFCKSLHYQCPKCGSAVIFPRNKKVGVDMIKCKECGQKMRTGM